MIFETIGTRIFIAILLSYGMAVNAAADDSVVSLLSSVREKYQRLGSYQCDYRVVNPQPNLPSMPGLPAEALKAINGEKKGKFFGSGVNKARLEIRQDNGHVSTELVDGVALWRFQSYSPQATKDDLTFGTSTPLWNALVSDGVLISETKVAKRAEKMSVKGTEVESGRSLTVLQDGQLLLWIDPTTGLIWKRETYSPIGDEPRMRSLDLARIRAASISPFRIEHFDNCTSAVDLAETTFTYVPPPGTSYKETWFENDERKEKVTEIPFQAHPLPKEQEAKSGQQIAELRSKFESLADLSATYKHEILADFQILKEGKMVSPLKVYKADLKLKKGGRLSLDYSSDDELGRPNNSGIYITDGKTEWKGTKGSGKLLNVTTETKGLLGEMLKSVIPIPPRPVDSMPARPQPLCQLHYDSPPLFVFELYDRIPLNATTVANEELLNGEPVIHLSNPVTEKNLKTDYWLAKADGFPRKIVEYEWNTDAIKATYFFSNISVNKGLSDDTFMYIKTSTSPAAMDLDARAPAMQDMMKNTFATPPLVIFQEFFSTDVSEVKNLRGSGTVWFTYDFHVRFDSVSMPSFKNETKLIEVATLPESIHSYFLEAFPEDKELIGAKQKNKVFTYDEGKKHIWFVNVPNKGAWYFRAWGDE